MNFLPEDYKIPKSTSGYMKFDDGLNQIRVLSSAIVGWEYFNTDNKPVRSKEPFEEAPTDIKKDGKVKPFWAFVVWNYNLNTIQILELTQKSIMNSIKAMVDNPKWGNPTKYDIAITKTGEGLETEYTVMGEPPIAPPVKEILDEYKAKPINLQALYVNADPFAKVESKGIEITKNDMPY